MREAVGRRVLRSAAAVARDRRRRRVAILLGLVLGASVAGCDGAGARSATPGLASHGTAMTTVKPTRQDLANSVSLAGKVTMDPVFGLVAPAAGQVRYIDVPAAQTTPTKPTRVATVVSGRKSYTVEIPAGSTLAGRLVDDKSTVTAGMPIVSARYVGYAIVADIDGAAAYKISDSLGSVEAQIKNGPGPFPCTVLGTIAALPAGTVPDPAPQPSTQPSTQPGGIAKALPPQQRGSVSQSDPTGMRLVCTGPGDVRLINGATATVTLVTAHTANALVLPVEAVAGVQGRGKVDVVTADGSRHTRDVVLGLTDGKVVEIKSGLTGTETVAVPGPNLPAPDPAGDTGRSGAPVPGTT